MCSCTRIAKTSMLVNKGTALVVIMYGSFNRAPYDIVKIEFTMRKAKKEGSISCADQVRQTRQANGMLYTTPITVIVIPNTVTAVLMSKEFLCKF